MAELLQYGRHEKQRRKAEQVAVSKDTNVYLETVETAKDTKTEDDGVGNARMGSLWRSLQPKSLLENGKRRSGQTSTNKRKTDKLGLLWFSHSLSVHARQLLKPPCTERYARWCERTAVSHRLLLDSSPAELEHSKSTLRFGRCKANVYWTFCNCLQQENGEQG